MTKNPYAQAGVDVQAGYQAVDRMKKHIDRTKRPEVLSTLGGFGGLFSLAQMDLKKPVLVSGTDGVGTKLLIAQESGILDTVGIDLVAMSVNDVLAQGARPLFFLDYLAVGKNNPEEIENLVKGVADGCVQAQVALIGGETAEMPDLYEPEEFDMAGFCVGVAEEDRLLDCAKVQAGDLLIGLPSSGLHSNGYSLVRKVFFKDGKWKLTDHLADGQALIKHLLKPTKIYVKEVLPLLDQGLITGMAHITGGGFIENVPRMYQSHLTAYIDVTRWQVPLIFQTLAKEGQIQQEDMYQIFNMGIGMVLAIRPDDLDQVRSLCPQAILMGYMDQNRQGQSLVLTGIEVDQ